jgi:RNA polymerase sigma-70 factor, ECF subfamily
LDSKDSQLDDKNLILLCQEGDRIAFERLFRLYSKDVYSMALRMVHSEELAEEVTQEVFISVYKDIQKFQFQSAFTTWLYRIVYRRAADQFRKIKKHKDHTVPFILDEQKNTVLEVMDGGAIPSDLAIENERNRTIEKAIASLSPKQRTIMILRYVQNLSYEEIAQILRCRIGTVKSRLNRAHKTMEEKLDPKDIF